MARDTAAQKEEKRRQKETMKITKFVRFNVPNKKHKINKEEMECFNGQDALETLMKSKFFVENGKEVPKHERLSGKFYTKEDCINFYKQLVYSRMAIRGTKVYKEKDEKKEKAIKDKKAEEKEADSQTDNDNKAVEKTDEKPKPKKKKYKVMMNQHQGFSPDADEIYVWLYNPTPFMHWVYGALVLLVVIGGTLFPLWPDTLRTGVYYGSISLASFIGGILVVGLLRTILFGLIWACTGGKHYLWILPNLLEDVGFFESFVPGYTWEVVESTPAVEDAGAEAVEDAGAEAVEDSSETKKDK